MGQEGAAAVIGAGGAASADEPTTIGGQMQIGVVAERTGLSIRTLRHYDDVGLVRPSARSAGGFRLYTEEDLERLRTIRRMKPLGFTLEEMRQLLDALDTLADQSASEESKRSADAVLTAFHARAEDSCQVMSRQLAYAQEFAALLGTKLGAPKLGPPAGN
jgi:MerR family transcriptional regulator, copper efflux regulator